MRRDPAYYQSQSQLSQVSIADCGRCYASRRSNRPSLRMISTLRDGAQYWRDRAKEAREHAEQMTDTVSKNTMLGIAQSYEFLGNCPLGAALRAQG
jgi:hypothetical protein